MIRSHSLWTLLVGWMMLFSPALAQKIYYVTADGKPLTEVPGITLRDVWKDPTKVTNLYDALAKAKAGDKIWIKGYEMGEAGDATFYRTTGGPFKVKSGVEIYGGFAGDETDRTQRRADGQLYRLHYRTILTADQGGDHLDAVDKVNYIYPDPTHNQNKRSDNSPHVLEIDMTPTKASRNNNTQATIINGCIIARGHAYKDPENKINGGGIYIHGDNTNGGGIFRIESCFFTENYGYYGGAIYVAEEVKNTQGKNVIDRCSFFNNAAGDRSRSENFGGAICLVGEGYVLNSTIYNNENGGVLSTTEGSAVVNCTVTRNTGSGVDVKTVKADAKLPVYNSVFWGNAQLTLKSTQLDLKYSAFPEVYQLGDSINHNLQLSEKNNEPGEKNDKGEVVRNAGPMFIQPSIRTGYDVDFKIREEAYPKWNWEPMEETTLVDKGSTELYNSIGLSRNPKKDLNDKDRIKGTSIDIGAYEFQTLDPSRIRYVKPDGKGKGTSWGDASGNLQAMIDDLAEKNPNLPGEVWVAGGTYKASANLIPEANYTASFRMRDGISVYGGFEGGEKTKAARASFSYPWETEQKKNTTVYLVGKDYDPNNNNLTNHRWNVNSSSRHVVWFAPDTYRNAQAPAFTRPTFLDRVCVVGGWAQHESTDDPNFKSGVGGGIYMNDANAYLRDCVVKYSSAKVAGGGVYLKSGRIIGSLIYNCNAGEGTEQGKGGGVFVDDIGMVLRSMIVNNTAGLGAGVYLNNEGNMLPNYLVLSTSVISSNTARINGGVYCNKGGVLTQNTITNNYTPLSPDQANVASPQTGGVYINAYGTVINSIIWNNKINLKGGGDRESAMDIPVYALNPTKESVRFLNNAISSQNNAVWNNIVQEGILALGDRNTTTADQMGPDFDNRLIAGPDDAADGTLDDISIENKVGAIGTIQWVRYYWKPRKGSNLWAAGKPIGQFPEEVLITPELDITGKDLFDQKPSIGAFQVIPTEVQPDEKSETGKAILYIDGSSTAISADGSSWATAHRSLTEAVDYFARWENPEKKQMVIRVKGQELWPRFAFANEDPKSATLKIPVTKSGEPILIEGSWHVEKDTAKRDPLHFRSILNSNHNGRNREDGNYHGVNVDPNAKVVLDGFHIINGYAASTAAIQSGAGVLAKAGSDVTLRNCVLENNTAVTAAAVDAREATKLTMINCVVNNNTNTGDKTESVIGVPSNGNHSFDHLTVVNNLGSAPGKLNKDSNSFAAGNSGGNTFAENELATIGEEGAKNFANPTKNVGATLGFDTYLGGYSEFRPLTSSKQAALIINKGKSIEGKILTEDITMVRDRDLGGIPDLGAFEANLPKKGRVYYVRTTGHDKNNDGLSWEQPFRTVRKAVETAYASTDIVNNEKPQVWVAAGTYQQEPEIGSNNCFEILDGVNVYGAFPKTGTPGMGDRHPFVSNAIYHDGKYNADEYETILKPLKEGRVLGQADLHNPYKKNPATTYEYLFVGDGKGDYVKTDEEYIVQENGEYYFGSGNKDGYWKAASEFADYWYVEEAGAYKYFSKAEKTINWNLANNALDFSTKELVEVGSNYGDYNIERYYGRMEYWYQDSDPSKNKYKEFTKPGGYYEVNPSISGKEEFEANSYNLVGLGKGNFIKVEEGKYYRVGKGFGNRKFLEEKDRYQSVGTGAGSYVKVAHREGAFLHPTTWDGFTLREGNVTTAMSNSNRNGGGGAAVFTNVTLKNCIVTNNSYHGSGEIRGGGIYCDEGKVVNCYIQNNQLGAKGTNTAYGAGIYFFQGTMYNCVIHNNTSYGQFTDGAGAFIENGAFFNNTVVYNHSKGDLRQSGGIQVYRDKGAGALKIYNCISLFNEGFKVYQWESGSNRLVGTRNFSVGNTGGNMECYNTITEELKNVDITSGNTQKITFDPTCIAVKENIFLTDYKVIQPNLRIQNGSKALNMGKDAPVLDDETIFLEDYTDMDFTDRIKDCRVDAGAYESENKENIKAEGQDVADAKKLTFYVTQNGAGSRSGESPANAACAMKLQRVLTQAGEVAKAHPDKQVVVKVAGYPNYGFTYHANTLSNPQDPQSYTYVVPYGVTLMGGFCEGLKIGDETYPANWEKNERDAAMFMTVLSAIKKSTTTQNVNGYHALTFGEKPSKRPEGTAEKKTIVDGVYLEDGAATSLVPLGDPRTRGGGAIVPEWGHMRNCVVRNNKARQGGGLYVLPGALVTGCGIMQNEASDEGGGIFADDKDADRKSLTKKNRAHLISNTLAENKANEGGGIYLKDGAALSVNMVVWGNTAGTDKNISGVVSERFEDLLFEEIQFGDLIKNKPLIKDWYPFNYSYIEQYEVPGNVSNTRMSSNKDDYFGQFFVLKPYSILIDKGMLESIQETLVTKVGVAAYDMQGKDRLGKKTNQEQPRIDVGAYAYTGGVMSTDVLVKRLFVSPANNVMIAEEKENDFMGRSFYTSFTLLEDVIDYINGVRKSLKVDKNDPQKRTVGELARNTTFEILMAKGTYKPQRQRINAHMTVYNQRLNSFTIPYNVEIYGGFDGTEKYSSFDKVTELPVTNGENIQLEACAPIDELCKQRGRSDHDYNLLLEPWELAAQTVLSGELNLSETEKNAYHVVYSERASDVKDEQGKITMEVPDSQSVVLDGVTILRGITHNRLQYNEVEGLAENEVGRGGGIFSKGVNYVLANCRVLENKAVRGGGVFVWDADLYLFNNLFAGNSAEHEEDVHNDPTKYSYGGALVVAATGKENQANAMPTNAKKFNLKAINNLWANNSAGGKGGAIAVYNTQNSSDQANENKFEIRLANNTLVRNKAKQAPVIYGSHTNSHLVNCLLWGNEGDVLGENQATANIYYSASDVDYHDKFGENNLDQNNQNKDNNQLIDWVNHNKKGPHFLEPSKQAGVEGYKSDWKWNPIAISPITDHGSGMIDQRKTPPEETIEPKPTYRSCWEIIIEPLKKYKQIYVTKSAIKEDPDSYERYSGPLDAATGKVLTCPIDIGFYEYQYISRFSTMPQIYVAEQRQGSGSGANWENATDDLRGAIIGAAHPYQDAKEHRTIYVKKGHYVSPSLNQDGTAFPINTSNLNDVVQLDLTIKGSCTGTGLGSKAVQDFSYPSYISAHPKMEAQTKQLFDISVNSGKRLTLEGFSLTNANSNPEGGRAVKVTNVADKGQVAFRQIALRGNRTGIDVGENALMKGGKLLAVNTLFADNAQAGLNFANTTNTAVAKDDVTLVNTTFANNGSDMSVEVPATYNSVAWNNKVNHMREYQNQCNKVFKFTGNATAAHNTNVLEGPNFVDPLNEDKLKRDYRIRPSKPLMDKGNVTLYLKHAMELEESLPEPASIPDSVKDLHNTNRQVGTSIDIGAYEYEALLQPIIYVQAGLNGGKADGSSWIDATGDLQGAVDLAGLYAEVNKGQTGYVFVHGNVMPKEPLMVSLPNAKIYGGMKGDEFLLDAEGKPSTDTEAIVKSLLSQRAGLLTHKEKSTLGVLEMKADAVVDGFQITDGAVVNAGVLSTSIVGSTDIGTAVTATVDKNSGCLYNSLVYGNVGNVRAVNVTATGTITGAADSGNNRAEVKEENHYVTADHWKYQLNETSTDINGGKVDVKNLMDRVGHQRDLIGNLRVRDAVDNGCFETWKLLNGGTAAEEDYPVGKSVVYVGSEKELLLTKAYTTADPFSPGFLLLEHHAGLRGNGKAVGLTNFAVERQLGEALGEDKKAYDMAVMPFSVTKMETFGKTTDASVQLYKYKAYERAKYNFKSGGEPLWGNTDFREQLDFETTGWLIEGAPDTRVRFYGRGYTESQGTKDNPYPEKPLSLKKWNYSDPWNGSSSSGSKFTHKENMSWNLFGSPYLCAMKYSDMEYGRVVYGYQNGQYVTVPTYSDVDPSAPKGYIPAGDAVFTQTATLKEVETFNVTRPNEGNRIKEDDVAYAGQQNLQVAIARQAATRAGEAVAADVLQLKAVAADQARTDFDLGSDGVKWTNMTAEPQIYAVQNGGHYSLLSAVNREGRVAAGVNLPEKGNFVFFLPQEVDADDYEVVLLHDAQTGGVTDLTEETYAFYSEVAGDIEDRFSLSFVRKTDDGTATIRVRRLTENTFRIEGTEAGDAIRIFSADGKVQAAATATGFSTTVEAGVPRVAIVEVKRNGRMVGVVKVR